jgi:hypothetical protein
MSTAISGFAKTRSYSSRNGFEQTTMNRLPSHAMMNVAKPGGRTKARTSWFVSRVIRIAD